MRTEFNQLFFAAGFSDPEGWHYLCRQLAYVGETGRALQSLSRCVDGGYFCFPALVSDPWLASLRGNSGFERVLATAQQRCEAARSAFEAEGGPQLLGMVQRSALPQA